MMNCNSPNKPTKGNSKLSKDEDGKVVGITLYK